MKFCVFATVVQLYAFIRLNICATLKWPIMEFLHFQVVELNLASKNFLFPPEAKVVSLYDRAKRCKFMLMKYALK